MQSFPLEARITPVELLIDSAVSLLLKLEAAQQERSVLFSDEQKLLFEGGKQGFVNSLSAKSVLAGEKLVATYSIST
jgi:hypothetical protein